MDKLAKLKELQDQLKNLKEEIYLKRLKDEFREIDAQDEAIYFLDLYDKQVTYPENQNNLLVPYLLGIVSYFDIRKESGYFYGEMPDI